MVKSTSNHSYRSVLFTHNIKIGLRDVEDMGQMNQHQSISNTTNCIPYAQFVYWKSENKLFGHFVRTNNPDSKVHGANMGPIRGRQDPGGPHVGPMYFAFWEPFVFLEWVSCKYRKIRTQCTDPVLVFWRSRVKVKSSTTLQDTTLFICLVSVQQPSTPLHHLQQM